MGHGRVVCSHVRLDLAGRFCRDLGSAVRRRPQAGDRRDARRAAHGARHAGLQRKPRRYVLGPVRDGRGAARARRHGVRNLRLVRYDAPRDLRQRDGGVSRAAREARRPYPGVVPASLGKRRSQGRQLARLRHAMGRPLRLHDRARRRQSPCARHARDARARDGSRPEPRPLTDRAAACGRQDVVRAAAAVRGPRLRTHRRARHLELAGQRRQLLGAQRDRACPRIRGRGRFAAAARQEAVRRRDPVARLRGGRIAAPGGLVGAHAADTRRQLGRQPAVAARRSRARPALGSGQHPAPRGVLEPRVHLVQPCPHRHRRHELPRLAAVVCADRRRLGHCRTHCDRPVRVFHGRDVVVPALAVVRQRTHDPACS